MNGWSNWPALHQKKLLSFNIIYYSHLIFTVKHVKIYVKQLLYVKQALNNCYV